MSEYMTSYFNEGNGGRVVYNPLRPYYTPGLHHQHNYTSLPSNDTIPGHTPEVFDHEETPFKNTAVKFASFAAFKYFMTMCTSPFDVGTTLLQVQYAPHQSVEVFAVSNGATTTTTSTAHNQEDASSSEDEDDGDFFGSPSASQQQQWKPQRSCSSTNDHPYARSVYDESSRPVHQMAPMEGGVLDILGRIVKQPTEGWKSLFKGQRITWIHELLWSVLQPGLESLLNDIFGLYDDTIPLTHLDNVAPNMITLIASHVVIGVLLSPLEILRTRFIVQSASPLNRKYNKGILQALRSMSREEGGVRNIYLSKNLAPTILYHTIRPLISTSIPIVIDRTLGISASDAPMVYSAAELVMSTLGLLVTLPLETIRKRLHCQVPQLPKEPRFETTVAIRPVPYSGIFDALYKIMKEEGTRPSPAAKNVISSNRSGSSNISSSSSSSDEEDLFVPQPKPKQKKNDNKGGWGIQGLYRGFGMQMAANFMVFILHALNGIEGDLSDVTF